MAYTKFEPWMLNGHPGNITRACRKAIVRAVNAGLVVTSTTDGTHAATSWHYPRKPWRLKGHAVDFAPVSRLPHHVLLERMRDFQRAEFDRGPKGYRELYGPLNNLCIRNGKPTTLANHSALEDQHDTHVHVAL